MKGGTSFSRATAIRNPAPASVCGFLRFPGPASTPVSALSDGIVDSKAVADWAILITKVKLKAAHGDGAFQDNFELWGNARVHFDDFTMARTNVGSPNNYVQCSRDDVEAPGDLAGIVIGGILGAGAVFATGGTALALVAAGTAVASVGKITASVGASDHRCGDGYIATMAFPVRLGVEPRHYSFVLDLVENDDFSADDRYTLDTRRTDNWSNLEECYGAKFDPSRLAEEKTCHFERSIHDADTGTFFGTVDFQTRVLAWVKGPVEDGRVEDFRDGNTIVTRSSSYSA